MQDDPIPTLINKKLKTLVTNLTDRMRITLINCQYFCIVVIEIKNEKIRAVNSMVRSQL